MSAARARPDPEFPAGHAIIRIPGAASAAGDPRFTLRRAQEYDRAVLGEAGWQVAAALLSPRAVAVAGEDLELHVGPAVANHLDIGVYQIALPAAHIEATLDWPNIAPLYEGPRSRSVMGRRPAPAQPAAEASAAQPPPQPLMGADDATVVIPAGFAARPEPEDRTVVAPRGSAEIPRFPSLSQEPPPYRPEPAPLPPPPAAPPKRHIVPVAIGLVVLLVLVSAGVWFGKAWWGAPEPTPVADQNQAPAQQPAGPAQSGPAQAAPVEQQAPPQASTGLESLPVIEAIGRASSPAQMQQEAERRLGSDRPDDALLMFEAAADRGSPQAKAMLGKLYDPNQPRRANIRPDARQAARYYREAARGGDNSTDAARAALRASLEAQAQRGDLNAKLIIQDFWP